MKTLKKLARCILRNALLLFAPNSLSVLQASSCYKPKIWLPIKSQRKESGGRDNGSENFQDIL